MICIGRHVGEHTLALQHGGQNGACNLQVAGRRLQVAGCRLQVAGCRSEFEVRERSTLK